MKKVTSFIICLSAIAMLAFSGAAFEGKITYEIAIEGGDMPPEAKAMFADSKLNVHIKGVKSRADVIMGFQNTSTISDSKANTSIMLMDIMGSKFKIKADPKTEGKATDVSVKYLPETKEIAGYKCKKAEITFKDESGQKQLTTVYYTEEIGNHLGSNQNAQFKGIKGMPLEYELSADGGMKMKMTAKKVSKESVNDSMFDIPSDYKETTLEDLQKDMMQKMQGGQH